MNDRVLLGFVRYADSLPFLTYCGLRYIPNKKVELLRPYHLPSLIKKPAIRPVFVYISLTCYGQEGDAPNADRSYPVKLTVAAGSPLGPVKVHTAVPPPSQVLKPEDLS